jgi:hypothetical protein
VAQAQEEAGIQELSAGHAGARAPVPRRAPVRPSRAGVCVSALTDTAATETDTMPAAIWNKVEQLRAAVVRAPESDAVTLTANQARPDHTAVGQARTDAAVAPASTPPAAATEVV